MRNGTSPVAAGSRPKRTPTRASNLQPGNPSVAEAFTGPAQSAAGPAVSLADHVAQEVLAATPGVDLAGAVPAPLVSPPLPPAATGRKRIAPVAGAKVVSNASLVDFLPGSLSNLFVRGWPWLLLIVAVLALLALRAHQRGRARRHALRVWNPGRAKRAVVIAPEMPTVDPLETPPWLANATRHRAAMTATLAAEEASATAAAPLAAVIPATPAALPLVEPATVPAPAPSLAVDAEPALPSPSPAPTPLTPTGSEYSAQIAALRGAALGPALPVPRVTLHFERQGVAHAAPAVPVPTAVPDVDNDRASPVLAPADMTLAQARRLATQDRPGEALAILRPRLDATASASTWAMAGWCAWKLAVSGRDPLQSAVEAAQAFAAALAADPSRRAALSRMIGRCDLLQADADLPARRIAHLQAAVSAYARGLGDCARPSQAGLLEWANAAAELAQAEPSERRESLAQLDAVLARGPGMQEATPAWCKLHAQSSWLHAMAEPACAERARWHEQAVAQRQAGYDRLDSDQRDRWLAESIDAERRYLDTLSDAARATARRAMEARIRMMLADTGGAAPWLAWIHVLADGARHLQGPAARQRLAEASAVFDRLEPLPVSADERQGIAFARGYYLRLRGMHEHGRTREQVLDEASRLLAQLRTSPVLSAGAVAMEQAEVALAQAREGQDELTRYREVVAHASVAADFPQTRVPAFRALLTALLAWQQRMPEPARASQIGVVAQWLRDADTPLSAESLGLLAAAAMLGGNAAEAARLSAAAWEAGAERGAVLPNWHRADAEWAKRLAESERPGWERQHRQLRLAAGSH